MTYWQTPSPAFSTRVEELSVLLSACRDAFHETADSFHWTPASGSPAASDAAALPSPDPAVKDPHGETGHRLIAEAVQIFLLSASGQVGGLAALYVSNEVLFSPPLLIRSVIENCAHALWILGDDPSEAPENRLARVYLEELRSAEEAKMNAGRLRGKTDATYLKARGDYTRVKAEILARFSSATKASLGEGMLNGQKLPRPEEAVLWMYSLTEAAGGTISQEAASGIYGLLSNLTHPTLYPAREQRRWVVDPATGYATAHLRVEVESVEKEARAAIAAFANALAYVTSYFGWPTAVLATLEEKINAMIPDFFR